VHKTQQIVDKNWSLTRTIISIWKGPNIKCSCIDTYYYYLRQNTIFFSEQWP